MDEDEAVSVDEEDEEMMDFEEGIEVSTKFDDLTEEDLKSIEDVLKWCQDNRIDPLTGTNIDDLEPAVRHEDEDAMDEDIDDLEPAVRHEDEDAMDEDMSVAGAEEPSNARELTEATVQQMKETLEWLGISLEWSWLISGDGEGIECILQYRFILH